MTPPCPVCGGIASFFLDAEDLNRRTSMETFRYCLCRACGFLFLSPLPPELGRYYPPGYHAIPPSRERLAKVAERERFKIDTIRRYCGGGRLLEIGPSTGSFALLAKAAGFSVDAIEMDAACSGFLERTVGIRVLNTGDVVGALRDSPPYDAIAMWHVVEHLPDPVAVLRVAADRLAPGGVLAIAAPNPGALQFRIFRRRWYHLDAPRHVCLFPPRVLAELLARCGLETVLETSRDPGSLRCNVYGWQNSLANFASRRLARAALGLAGLGFGMLMSPVELMRMNGSSYTMVFRRTER